MTTSGSEENECTTISLSAPAPAELDPLGGRGIVMETTVFLPPELEHLGPFLGPLAQPLRRVDGNWQVLEGSWEEQNVEPSPGCCRMYHLALSEPCEGRNQ